jgi:hypothetical protein
MQQNKKNMKIYANLSSPRSMITATGSRRILQERSGNVAGSCRKEAGMSPDPAGKPWKSPEVEAVFRPEIYWIFSGGFLSISCAFRQEPVGNHRKKSEKFPVGILLPRSSDFRCFPAGTGP